MGATIILFLLSLVCSKILENVIFLYGVDFPLAALSKYKCIQKHNI